MVDLCKQCHNTCVETLNHLQTASHMYLINIWGGLSTFWCCGWEYGYILHIITPTNIAPRFWSVGWNPSWWACVNVTLQLRLDQKQHRTASHIYLIHIKGGLSTFWYSCWAYGCILTPSPPQALNQILFKSSPKMRVMNTLKRCQNTFVEALNHVRLHSKSILYI